MAKNPSTVIGIDVGRNSLKAVLMQRKGGGRYVLHGYKIIELAGDSDATEKFVPVLRAAVEGMKAGLKFCGVAVSGAETLVRIIDQPPTPREVMRDALRLNGMALLGQDVRQMVLDCDVIETAGAAGGFGVEDSSRAKFLVAGLSRKRVDALGASFAEIKAGLKTIQLAPVAAFNAFEFAQEQTFNNDAFLILDVGHQSSTVIVGVKRSVVLVRTIEYGGNMLFQSLMDAGAHSPRAAMEVLEQGDDLLVEAARISLATLTREISSSIGFFEGRCEENISRVYISGGLAQSRAVIQTLAEELHLPCMAWNPFERCEIALPEAARAAFRNDMVNLHVACGVAVEMLKGN